MNYREAVFKTHRLIIVSGISENSDFNEENFNENDFKKVMTLNENLLTLGYTLSPKDLFKIIGNRECEILYDKICSYLDCIPAKPLFPKQLLGMEEAVYRLYQIKHYFSVYGMEQTSGMDKFTRCHLPVEEIKRVKEDERLINAKVLEIIDEKEAFIIPLKRTLSKKGRMTPLEMMIVQSAVANLQPVDYFGLDIPFKKNLFLVFYEVFKKKEQLDALTILHNLCPHVSDTIKCIDFTLIRNHYKLKTSEKRLFVKLLESYPISDFKNSLISSNKKAERCKVLLNFLSYNSFSKSIGHRVVVKDLRNSNLKSWESNLNKLIEKKDWESVLSVLEERPWVLLQKFAWLVRLGIDQERITSILIKNVQSLSVETLIKVLTKFGRLQSDDESSCIYKALENVLFTKLQTFNTALKNKKVFLNFDGFDLNHSEISLNVRSMNGNYIRSGIAYKIPESVDKVRAFVYWNDKKMVDVDLHSSGITCNGDIVHVGWNDAYAKGGVVTSEDFIVSDSAEYIDVDLTGSMLFVKLLVDTYSGKESFQDLNECYCGMMAIENLGEEVKLYDKKNCFFSHNLKNDSKIVYYGCIDVKNKVFIFKGQDEISCVNCTQNDFVISRFSIQRYLDLLLAAQNAVCVKCENDADVVITMEKSTANAVSLLDSNFFCK